MTGTSIFGSPANAVLHVATRIGAALNVINLSQRICKGVPMAGKRAGGGSKNDADRLVGAAAAELYGLPLEEFTAARNDRAKQARAQGQTEAAQAIAKLGKPNIVGWLANQLVREQREEIDPLLELGASLREATSALDAGQLRALSKQQHQVVHGLVHQARKLGSAAGQTVSDGTARGLEDTLHAALADPAAADELLVGQLTTGLSRSGFPGVDVTATQPAKRAAAAKPVKPDRRAQAKQARQDAAEARAEAKAANTKRDQAQRALQQAEKLLQRAADDIERRKAELDDAVRARSDAEKARRQAAKDAERTERLARQADRRVTEATSKR
jgi:hypothetical protein